MARIFVMTLGKEMERSILRHEYSFEQMTQMRDMLQKQLDNKRRAMRRVTFFSLFTAAVLAAMTALQAGMTPAVAVSFVVMLFFILVALAFAWFACVSHWKRQYNKAVEKGYPQFLSELHL